MSARRLCPDGALEFVARLTVRDLGLLAEYVHRFQQLSGSRAPDTDHRIRALAAEVTEFSRGVAPEVISDWEYLMEDGRCVWGWCAFILAFPDRHYRISPRRSPRSPASISLRPNLTGRQALDVLVGLLGRHDAVRGAELIGRFALDPSQKVRSYSAGNRQKVMLVAAFAARTPLLAGMLDLIEGSDATAQMGRQVLGEGSLTSVFVRMSARGSWTRS